ncbi:MAG TPA: hypothetical protein VHZ76_09930 [Gammaproteobacteria bacterium]|jgi:hypothetical protein|nr:hypothetical protein [Gammaproteobacteria bacterium]
MGFLITFRAMLINPELQLYILETEEIKDFDLNEIVSTAEAKLKKYSKYL